jgi:hypothetical protein
MVTKSKTASGSAPWLTSMAPDHGPRPRARAGLLLQRRSVTGSARPPSRGRRHAAHGPASRLLSRGRLLALPLSGAVRTVPTFNCDSAWSAGRGARGRGPCRCTSGQRKLTDSQVKLLHSIAHCSCDRDRVLVLTKSKLGPTFQAP